MDLFLAISQGIGTSLAAGVRTFLVPLLVGAMARADIGVDFDGTEYEFLESIVWLAIMLAMIVGAWWVERSGIPVSEAAWAVAAAAIGGVLFAGSLSERDYMSELGLFAGALVALAAFMSARVFLGGAEERLSARDESGAGGTFRLIVDFAALALAAIAVLLEPVACVALAFCAWVLLVRRRRAAEKYEGLRILR
ncbi:MAG: hypothetical protein ACRDLQ_06820 [Solirubrobacterales bacterium]